MCSIVERAHSESAKDVELCAELMIERINAEPSRSLQDNIMQEYATSLGFTQSIIENVQAHIREQGLAECIVPDTNEAGGSTLDVQNPEPVWSLVDQPQPVQGTIGGITVAHPQAHEDTNIDDASGNRKRDRSPSSSSGKKGVEQENLNLNESGGCEMQIDTENNERVIGQEQTENHGASIPGPSRGVSPAPNPGAAGAGAAAPSQFGTGSILAAAFAAVGIIHRAIGHNALEELNTLGSSSEADTIGMEDEQQAQSSWQGNSMGMSKPSRDAYAAVYPASSKDSSATLVNEAELQRAREAAARDTSRSALFSIVLCTMLLACYAILPQPTWAPLASEDPAANTVASAAHWQLAFLKTCIILVLFINLWIQ